MTNKENLQKEILEKIKPGTKPSDLKKQKVKNIKDEGYSSDEEPKKNIPTPPTTPNQKIKELETQISSLKKQLQTYKDFKEADLKIKEKYKQKISDLENTIHDLDYLLKTGKNSDIIKKLQTKIAEQDKTIQELKNQGKDPVKVKQETFTCYHCKKEQELSLLVLELPEGKLCQPCWTILRKKTKEKAKEQNPQVQTPQLFTCVACDQKKQETPIYKKVEISYKKHLIKGKEYPVCSTCSPHVKEYNEDENRELDPWE